MSKGFHESCRHGLIVFLGISKICEYLCKGFLVVDLHEMSILLECFLLSIQTINVCAAVVVIMLIVDDGLQWQTIGEGRALVRPPNS